MKQKPGNLSLRLEVGTKKNMVKAIIENKIERQTSSSMTARKASPEREKKEKEFIRIETDQKNNMFTFQ